MVQSPSWEANWFAASQEIFRILWKPKVHYRTHKHPPPVSILGQSNPVHIPTSHILKIRHNIIHPSTPRSPQWSLSPRFPHQDPIHPPLLTHTRHMSSPSHFSRFYHPQNIGWGVQIVGFCYKNTLYFYISGSNVWLFFYDTKLVCRNAYLRNVIINHSGIRLGLSWLILKLLVF